MKDMFDLIADILLYWPMEGRRKNKNKRMTELQYKPIYTIAEDKNDQEKYKK